MALGKKNTANTDYLIYNKIQICSLQQPVSQLSFILLKRLEQDPKPLPAHSLFDIA